MGLPRGIAIGVAVVSTLVFYALTTHGSFSPLYEQTTGPFAGHFFFAQAKSLVHGHLYVSPADLPGECFLYQGHCYGYFGLTPSLLRVPLLPILNGENRGLTSVYLTLALLLAIGSALAIASRVLADVPRTRLNRFLMGALAVSLGPASVIAMAARPAVFEEAIAWSVAFALFGIYCFLRWWNDGGRGWATLVVLSLVRASNGAPGRSGSRDWDRHAHLLRALQGRFEVGAAAVRCGRRGSPDRYMPWRLLAQVPCFGAESAPE
jgi:hypothetical protein